MLPIIGCAQELFSVTTKYNFNDSVKTVIITFKNTSDGEVIVNNIWMNDNMPDHSHFELLYLDENDQVVSNYFFAFTFGPMQSTSRLIHIKPHSSVTFEHFNPYYRIESGAKNVNKIKKFAIRYHIEYYIGEGSVLFYDKTEPAVVL
jgi:hypothetical protein